MTVGVLSLVEFLLARIAEDEAWAKRGVRLPPDGNPDDPARVLAECEAKRRIVKTHPMMDARLSTLGEVVYPNGDILRPYYTDGVCSTCTAGAEYGESCDPRTGELNYCTTLRTLAAVYADHPDYRAEWKP